MLSAANNSTSMLSILTVLIKIIRKKYCIEVFNYVKSKQIEKRQINTLKFQHFFLFYFSEEYIGKLIMKRVN